MDAVANANGNCPEFDAAYKAAQAPQVRKLMEEPVYENRETAAIALSHEFLIDVPIMVNRWDPFKMMSQRKYYGYTSVPALQQANVVNAPGVNGGSGATGAIKVSIDFDDYPPYQASEPK